MYHKRLKAYKQIGYDIFSGIEAQKQTTNTIFDIDNYTDIYQNDLLTAEKEIIISSPAISGKKVYEMKGKNGENFMIPIKYRNPARRVQSRTKSDRIQRRL